MARVQIPTSAWPAINDCPVLHFSPITPAFATFCSPLSTAPVLPGFVNSSSLVCRFGPNATVPAKFFTGSNRIYVGAGAQGVARKVLVSCSNDGVVFSKAQPHDYFTFLA